MPKPIKITRTYQEQSPEEEARFIAVLDALIEKLVREELTQLPVGDGRKKAKSQGEDAQRH